MGAPHPNAPVSFDFAGALALASACWQAAAQLTTYESSRHGYAVTALKDWSGTYADNFVDRINTCAGTAQELQQRLQQTANLLAAAWQHAATQNQYNLWAEYCQKLDNKRSTLQHVEDWFTGDHTKFPPQPAAAPLPSSPDFATSFDPTTYTPPPGFSQH